ncbi:DNA-binding protein [Ferriphaselus sp. R-1]|uniref:DNA-binding protein n=1 Tax=Ferriphaselus sp. R-1 TaxID=1485544 RepID=UPI0009E074FC|nr:DNA-binding protein [Ferriphaselus sp. R-1]
MSRYATYSDSEIIAVAERLRATGESVNANKVIKELGGGNHPRVARVLAEQVSSTSTNQPLYADSGSADIPQGVADAAIDQILDDVKVRFATLLNQVTKHANLASQEMETELDRVTIAKNMATDELQKIKSEVLTLRQQIVDLNQSESILKQELEEAKAYISTFAIDFADSVVVSIKSDIRNLLNGADACDGDTFGNKNLDGSVHAISRQPSANLPPLNNTTGSFVGDNNLHNTQPAPIPNPGVANLPSVSTINKEIGA